MIHIWIIEHDRKTFWKEHGNSAWSRNIKDLMTIIDDGYEIKYCDNDNQIYGKWEDCSSTTGERE